MCSGAIRRSSSWRPRPNLPEELRDKMCADAVAFARHIGYSCAGTVEFLLDERGHHVFIEMNPRIQVEHTVTEEITDVDLVSSQLRIAGGETLDDLGLRQEHIRLRGAALQCRITTEDPANGFRPGHRADHDLPQPGWSGNPSRRRDEPRRRDQRALRLHAGQADLPGARLPYGGQPGPARDRGVPHPWRVDEYPFPAGDPGRSGLFRPATSPRRSSRSIRRCSPRGRRPTAAPRSSTTWPT